MGAWRYAAASRCRDARLAASRLIVAIEKGFRRVTEVHHEADGENKPLRIVHVLRAPVGGLFRHVLDLAHEQIARGHSVGLIADSLTGGERGESQLGELAPRLALGLMRLPMRRMPHPSDVSNLIRITRRLAALAPDVVHGHGSKGGLNARLAGFPWRVSNAIRVYTPHGGSLNYHPGSAAHRFFMAMEWLLAWRTDLLLFESGYIAERYHAFVGAPNGLERIVRNGVGPEELEPVAAKADAAELLYVGEFRAAKGLDTLIDALGVIAQRTSRRPKLALVGDGPDLLELQARAERIGVLPQMTFNKPMPARDAFALGRIMVTPSRAESLPYIVLEAAGAQLPLIATNVGGLNEIYGPYSDRLIACDDPSTLAEAMLSALDEAPEAQRAKACELRDYVASHFAISAMVDGVLAGYRDALSARKTARQRKMRETATEQR